MRRRTRTASIPRSIPRSFPTGFSRFNGYRRQRSALCGLCAAAALAHFSLLATAGAVAADETSAATVCGDPDSVRFPLAARIPGDAPDTYTAGGSRRTWTVELHNTTDEACRAIHPVVVLVDQHRAMRPEQIRLEYYAPDVHTWRPVPLETSDQDEYIGVLGDGFPGFVVPPSDTVPVRLRMGFGPEAVAGDGAWRVRATVAAVQRRRDDGDWVGESDDYAFTVAREERADSDSSPELAATGRPSPAVLAALASAAVLLGLLGEFLRRARGGGAPGPAGGGTAGSADRSSY
ncbi:hypothetical protein [Streptomyces sp. GC420]|uniref:hypothetical protein n=1 Tax=Streptomyces sp. GC420 TaxID=2697568 RepID=UPI001414EC95|nr:hypothetical protein [Streptomyces sp. GC420]NBM16779.1 hypothetical protein [Streptomyces sp. GC420]